MTIAENQKASAVFGEPRHETDVGMREEAAPNDQADRHLKYKKSRCLMTSSPV